MTEPFEVNLNSYRTQRPRTLGAEGDAGRHGHRNQKVAQVCREFESLFVQHMLQEMRKTVNTGELFGGGQAEQLYAGMLDTELAKEISGQRGIGLAAVLYSQIAESDIDPGGDAD